MAIGREEFDLAIAKSDSRIYKIPLLESVAAWLREQGVGPDICDLLQEHSYSSWIQIGRVTFNCANEIVNENSESQNHATYRAGLLIVGSGLNGDPIVVNTKTGMAGFLSHDELWESDAAPDLAITFCELPESLGEFYLAAATSETYPVDFYEARDWCKRVQL